MGISTELDNRFGLPQFNENILDNFYRTYLFDVTIFGSSTDKFSCEWLASTNTPATTHTVQMIDYYHSQVKQAGRVQIQNWNITVRDNVGSNGENAYNYFQKWRDSIYDFKKQEHKDTTPMRYKKSAILKLLNTTEGEKNRVYELKGIWPQEIQPVSLSFDSEEISTFSVILQIDFFTVYDETKISSLDAEAVLGALEI